MKRLVLLSLLSVAACATTPPPTPAPEPAPVAPAPVLLPPIVEEKVVEPPKPEKMENKGLTDYKQGLRYYADGQFPQAGNSLKKALSKGVGKTEKVSAHKHLAFIGCVTGDETSCRAEFNKMLAINPRAELTKAEAGHPTWGPIFLEVKAARKKR